MTSTEDMTTSTPDITAEATVDHAPTGAAKAAAIRDALAYAERWVAFQGELLGTPGIQLAVRHKGELLLDMAWGVADVVTQEPLTTSHLFRIASHSKTFTATAAMQLVESGELRLDDTIERWVPALAGSGVAAVTVRELLGHQGGIIRDGSDANYWQRGGGVFPDRDAIIAMARAEGVVYEVNEHFKYSNIGYSLLGLVLEGASGMSYAELVAARITGPLGTTSMGPEWVAERDGEFAAGHTGRTRIDEPRHRIRHVDTAAMAPATGWFATAAELTAYGSAHAFGNATLVTDASKRLLQRPESAITHAGVTRHYGLGFDVESIGSRAVVGHSGGYPGHITRTWIDPKDDLVVSALTNAIDGPAGTIATGVVAIVDLALALAEEVEADPSLAVPQAIAAELEGRFANLWSVEDVVPLGGRLVTLYPKAPEPTGFVVRLRTTDVADALATDDVAGFWATGEPAVFGRDADGAVETLTTSGMTSWRIDVWRDALASGDLASALPRVSL
ncbi:serine hydrolase domain-containing protein [Agrococcus sp. SGAir0287]|uniref:serine hydrolase domain-containing protein n=1 Tax=Agrococcus sp. SGAir0287 TaxID=2070347 RepID=UPI0010CD0A0D|nr:serine hydrolase domain-containing protein [Agrococcus sp. SGAir0287]QCR18097.1 serine hydrolase [Agrococcus sp. SGAir0287]